MQYLRGVNDKLKAHLALLGANLFYGAGFTVAKGIMPRLIEPLGFIFIRVSVVMVLFWLSFFGGEKFRAKIAKKDWPILVLGGLFGVALNQMLFFLGLNLTFPIHASLIMMSTPLLITVISFFVLKQRITWDKALGLALGIGGAGLLMSAGKELTLTGNSALGDLFVFLNAASYAIYLVMIKPLMQRYRPIVVIRWVFFFGFLFVLPFGWPQFSRIDWSLFTVNDYLSVAFIVICVTFFTYLWNIYALRHLPPSTAGAYIYLQPIFAAVISIIVIGEELTWVKLLSTALIFSGVYLVNFGLKRKEKLS
ncbi:DMT family transporter [Polluticoccus soli]|uniref:DMT family transporter n=1 Tax=Polluticoccus soli TaxID=3034150 RepID=UPI0023E13CC1|nr:DMT family transporter [Flavipsychrobacter sp. JY13-12]